MKFFITLGFVAFIECSATKSLLSYASNSFIRYRLQLRTISKDSKAPGHIVTKLRGGGRGLELSSTAAPKQGDFISQKSKQENGISHKELSILFLGSGVSTGLPKLGCIVRPDQTLPECAVCKSALNPNSRNRRGNVSVLLRFQGEDGRIRSIMVDAGKTMREACLRFLPMHSIRGIDALLLTHAHADAILGISFVFDLQAASRAALTKARPPAFGRAGRPARLFGARWRAPGRSPAPPGVSRPGNLRGDRPPLRVRRRTPIHDA